MPYIWHGMLFECIVTIAVAVVGVVVVVDRMYFSVIAPKKKANWMEWYSATQIQQQKNEMYANTWYTMAVWQRKGTCMYSHMYWYEIQQFKHVRNRDTTIRLNACANGTNVNSWLPAAAAFAFRFLCWCAPIVDGGFWMESCNRTSVLLWTVTSLNRCRFYSASPLYTIHIIRLFQYNFEFHTLNLKNNNKHFDNFDTMKLCIDISFE